MKRDSNINSTDSGFDSNPIEFNISVPPSNRTKEQAWDMLMQTIEGKHAEPARVVTFQPNYKWLLAAASVIILMLVGSLFILNTEYRFETMQAQTLEHTLPDGSVVHLNASSWISYKKSFGWFGRNVRMEREAYFKVKSGKGKFVVADNQNQKVVVTGTEFSLVTRGDSFEVRCFEGSVNVLISGLKPVGVKKGESVTKSNGMLIHSKQSDKELTKPVWVTHEFEFAEEPLSQVFQQISNFYNIQISAEGFDPASRYFSGTIPAGKATDVLDVVSISMGLSYTVNADSTVYTFR